LLQFSTLGSIGFAQALATDVGKGAKDTGKATETVAKDIARGTAEAAKDTAHVTDKAATDVARGTKKTGRGRALRKSPTKQRMR
jgi:hypothetical protein